MLTSTATTAAADQKTRRGFGCQPRLLAHSIPARPTQHSVMAGYMMKLVAKAESAGGAELVRQRGERQQHRQRRLDSRRVRSRTAR